MTVIVGAHRFGGAMRLTTDYEAWLTGQGLSANTIRQRTKFAAGRLHQWGSLDQPPEKIAAWLAGYEGWTRRTYLIHLRSLYRWALEAGHVTSSPVAYIRQTPRPQPRPRPLTAAEVARVLAAATPTQAAWVKLGCLAGLRAHEIAKFRGEDITPDALWVMGKGGQGAMLPTHPDLWVLAERYPQTGYWFPGRGVPHVSPATVTASTGDLFRRVGLAGSIHRCRATYGTGLLRSGANLRVVQELMRHRSLATTAHYLGVAEDEKRRALAALVA